MILTFRGHVIELAVHGFPYVVTLNRPSISHSFWDNDNELLGSREVTGHITVGCTVSFFRLYKPHVSLTLLLFDNGGQLDFCTLYKYSSTDGNADTCTVCCKKVSPKVVRHLLSKPLGIFMWNYPRLLSVHIHIKMPSSIWLPSITAKLQNFLCHHIVIFAHSKISVRKDYTDINKWATLLSWWRQSDANFENNKSVLFIHRQFLDAFGKAFIVDATTVS